MLLEEIELSVIELVLTNRADEHHKNFFEEYGDAAAPCRTCHCGYGPMFVCRCGNIVCEACVVWSRSNTRVLNLNPKKRLRKKQRYVLESMMFNSYNCNICKKVVGYRF